MQGLLGRLGGQNVCEGEFAANVARQGTWGVPSADVDVDDGAEYINMRVCRLCARWCLVVKRRLADHTRQVLGVRKTPAIVDDPEPGVKQLRLLAANDGASRPHRAR